MFVKAVKTVGAGDSSVAGFVAAISDKTDYDYALKNAICAGSTTAFSKGMGSYELVQSLLDKSYSVTEDCFI
ncbi:MAG: hypothetical protein II252_03435 [Clostridia bacterium]|nr:hypothetical protein [Clostridia bacterium]